MTTSFKQEDSSRHVDIVHRGGTSHLFFQYLSYIIFVQQVLTYWHGGIMLQFMDGSNFWIRELAYPPTPVCVFSTASTSAARPFLAGAATTRGAPSIASCNLRLHTCRCAKLGSCQNCCGYDVNAATSEGDDGDNDDGGNKGGNDDTCDEGNADDDHTLYIPRFRRSRLISSS